MKAAVGHQVLLKEVEEGEEGEEEEEVDQEVVGVDRGVVGEGQEAVEVQGVLEVERVMQMCTKQRSCYLKDRKQN